MHGWDRVYSMESIGCDGLVGDEQSLLVLRGAGHGAHWRRQWSRLDRLVHVCHQWQSRGGAASARSERRRSERERCKHLHTEFQISHLASRPHPPSSENISSTQNKSTNIKRTNLPQTSCRWFEMRMFEHILSQFMRGLWPNIWEETQFVTTINWNVIKQITSYGLSQFARDAIHPFIDKYVTILKYIVTH